MSFPIPYLNKILTVFLMSAGIAVAQPVEVISLVTGRPQTKAAQTQLQSKAKAAMVTLPFIEDFSYDSPQPDPQLWEDSKAFINRTYAVQPPTLGVATFDGLDEVGQAYDFSKLNTDSIADVLTSQEIDLSSTVDSVYLTFAWQPGGVAKATETSDSLVVEFYNPALQSWNWVWGTKGTGSFENFRYAQIPITDAAYLQSNFKFRFAAYVPQSGSRRIWNVDEVLLDDQRRKNDTIREDISFTEPHPSLLAAYEAIPWFRYVGNVPQVHNKQRLEVKYRKNIIPPTSASLNLGLYRIELPGFPPLAQTGAIGPDPNPPAPNTETNYGFNIDPFPLPAPPTNEFELISSITYSGNLLAQDGPNDTIYKVQKFRNYYAYDDGSAERGYGVDGLAGAYSLTKFELLGADTLIGLYLYFLPSERDVTSNTFQLVVFSESNGEPGSLIYESDSIYTPIYTHQDFYLPYLIDPADRMELDGTVFIGVKQKLSTPLLMGFDVNSPNRTTSFFGSPGALWWEVMESGSIMLRPFFNYVPTDISVAENRLNPINIQLYPMPASDYINVTGPSLEEGDYSYEIYNMSGATVMAGKLEQQISTLRLQNGLYVMKVTGSENEIPSSFKIVINH